MPITVHFADGKKRPYDTATFADRGGGKVCLSDAQGDEVAAFDAEQVLFAVVKDENEAIVNVVEGTKIVRRSRRNHSNALAVTVHQYGAQDVFGADFSDQQGPAFGQLSATEKEAQDAADRLLAEQRGHRCTDACSGWLPV